VKKIDELLDTKRFHLLLIVSSLFLFFVALAKTEMGAPESSVFWYVSRVHFTFWPGLLLAAFSMILSIRNKRTYLAFISILLPVFYLYTFPNLAHEMIPVFDVYHVIPSVFSIMETGSWDANAITFPGSHIYQASSVIVLDIELFTYARLFPTLLAFSIVIFIYTISRRISARWAPIAPLVFLSLNWYMEYHLARQPFTVMLWTAFWLTLFLYVEKHDYRLGILSAFMLFALVPSHPGMLIIVGFNMVFLTLAVFISLRDSEKEFYFKPVIPLIFVFVAAAGIFYTFVPSINSYVDSVIEDFMDNGTVRLSFGGPASTSIQYQFVNRLRMLAGIFQSLLALLGVLALYRKVSKRALLIGGWFFSVNLWLVYPFTHQGRYIERAFLAALIPASVLSVALLKYYAPKNLDLRNFLRVSIVVILVAFLLVVPITKNSIDAIETPSRSSYEAGKFIERNSDERVHITDTHEGMFRYIEMSAGSERKFRSRGTHPEEQPYGYPIPRTDSTELSPMMFTDYFNNYVQIRYGNSTAVRDIERLEERYSRTSSRVYDSGGSRVYINP